MNKYAKMKWNIIYKVYGITQQDIIQFIHKLTEGKICNNYERLETLLLNMLLHNIKLYINDLLEEDKNEL